MSLAVDLDWDNYNSPVVVVDEETTTEPAVVVDELTVPIPPQSVVDDDHDEDEEQQENHIKKRVLGYKPRVLKQPVLNINFLIDHLIFELEASLEYQLDSDLVEFIRATLLEHEEYATRKLEEKDVVIGELKQSLLELTEKRFRAHLNNSENHHQPPLIDIKNIEFMLNEKDNQLNGYATELRQRENEVASLKETIKQQDDIILSHNSNIYELKNSTESVQKSKQESFRVLSEDLTRKQKLIDDQAEVIKSLKEKIESLEEQYTESRVDLEKRLSERETDLQVKIAQFESNLLEGKHYFEDMLAEKDLALREQAAEMNRLRERLSNNEQVQEEEDGNSTTLNDSSILLTSSMLNQSSNVVTTTKYDSENMKSIKSLYEHQIDLLKVKIEMLEKTCADYRQGIKEMNRNFGFQQQNDEHNSMQIFKDLMQQLQKTNVQLETERIDLQVKVSKMKEELEQLRIEKENVAKKLAHVDQHNQKLSAERVELESTYKRLMESKSHEINSLNDELYGLKVESERLRAEYDNLVVISQEYESLKVSNQQLHQHYEQLYHQATDIVNGNQLLNEQVNSSKVKIEALEAEIEDYKMTFEKLKQSNSELNTEKINLEMKLSDAESILKEQETAIGELNELRDFKSEAARLSQRLVEIETELAEKTELIDQLSQAKDFLAENNSKLLTNNIKMQILVESLGAGVDDTDLNEQLESNPKVREYELMCDKVSESDRMLNELRIKLKELEIEYLNYKMDTESVLEEREASLAELAARVQTLTCLVEKTDIWTQYDEETCEFKIHVHTQYDLDEREFTRDVACQCGSSDDLAPISTIDDETVVKVEETKAKTTTAAPSSMWDVEDDILIDDTLTTNATDSVAEGAAAAQPPISQDDEDVGEVMRKRVEELEARNEELADQLKQFEFNFVEIQAENDAYLTEINELKERLDDLKLKTTHSPHGTPTTTTSTRSATKKRHGNNNRMELVDQWSSSNNDVDHDHTNVVGSIPTDYLEQLKQYEASIESAQNENDSLLDEIDKLNVKLRDMENASGVLKTQHDELVSKLALTEKQNLKLKAKLKQLLSTNKEEKHQVNMEQQQQQQQQLNSSTSSTSTEMQTSLSWSDLAEMEVRNAGLTAVIKQLEVLLSSDHSSSLSDSSNDNINHNNQNNDMTKLSLPQLNNNNNNDLDDASNTAAKNNTNNASTEGGEEEESDVWNGQHQIDPARLVSFGATLVSQAVLSHLTLLSSEVSNLILTHQLNMSRLREASSEYQAECERLKSENEKIRGELTTALAQKSSSLVDAETRQDQNEVVIEEKLVSQQQQNEEPSSVVDQTTVKSTGGGWEVEDWDNLNENEENQPDLDNKQEQVIITTTTATHVTLSSLANNNQEVERLSKMLAQRETELVEMTGKYEAIVAELNNARAEFEQAQSRLQNLAQYQQFELEEQITELNQILNEKDAELTKKNTDYDLLLARIQSNESRLSAETVQLESTREIESRVDELERELMSKESELATLRSDLESVQQVCGKTRAEWSEACNENETLNQQFEQEKSRLNQILNEKQADLDARSVEYATLVQSYQALKSELDDTYANFEQEMNRLNQLIAQRDTELARMNTSLVEQQYQFEKIQSEMMKEKQEQVDKMSEELESMKKKYDTLRVKAHAMKEKLKRAEVISREESSPSPVPMMKEEATNSTSSMGSVTAPSSDELVNNIHKSYLDQIKQYEENFAQLELDNEKLTARLDQIVIDHDLNVKQIHQSYLDQLKQYESSVQSFVEDNERLKDEIQLLTQKLTTTQSSLSDEISAKLANYDEMQKLNMKLKAKVKLLLAKDKERQHQQHQQHDVETQLLVTASSSSTSHHHLYDDDRSGCVTPVFNQSTIQHVAAAQTHTMTTSTSVDTQTLLDVDELLERAEWLESEQARYEKRIQSLTESNEELSRLVEELRATTSQDGGGKQRIESSADDNVTSYTIVEGQDSEDTIRDLREKLETAQQMNLKLKAKLKQMIKSSKNENSEMTPQPPLASSVVSQSDQSTQTECSEVIDQEPTTDLVVELEQLRQFRMESEPYTKSLQDINYTLNMELESYKQFKTQTDAYIANVLGENARLVSELSEATTATREAASTKSHVDFETQVEDQEKQDLSEECVILREQLESERIAGREQSALLEELRQRIASREDLATQTEDDDSEEIYKLELLHQELDTYKQLRVELEASNSNLILQNQELSETINALNSYKHSLVENSCQTDDDKQQVERSEADVALIDTLNQELDSYRQYRIDMEAYTASMLSQIGLLNERVAQFDQYKQSLVEQSVQTTDFEIRNEQDVALIYSQAQQIEQFNQFKSEMDAYTANLISENSQLVHQVAELTTLLQKEPLVENSCQTEQVEFKSESDQAELESYRQYRVDMDVYTANLVNQIAQLSHTIEETCRRRDSMIDGSCQTDQVEFKSESDQIELDGYRQYRVDMEGYAASLTNQIAQLSQTIEETNKRRESLIDGSSQTDQVEFKTESDQAIVDALNQELEGYRQYRVDMESYTSSLTNQIAQLSQTIEEMSSTRKDSLVEEACQTDEEYRNPADLVQIESMAFQLEQFNQYKIEMDAYVATMTSQNAQLVQTVNELSKRESTESFTQTEEHGDTREQLVERIKNLESELTVNKSELEQLRDNANVLSNEVFDLRQARQESEDQVNDLVAENAKLSHHLNQIQARVFESVQVQTEDDYHRLDAELRQVKQDRDRLIQETSNLQASLSVFNSKQVLLHSQQVQTELDEEKETLRSANESLSQEIVQFKQFKTDCESYISNLLNEYAKVAASLQQYEQAKMSSSSEVVNNNNKQTVDSQVQVDLIENRDTSDLQLVIDSLRQANLILNQELSELKKQQRTSAASATSEKIKQISQADSELIFSLQAVNNVLNHELSELKQIDQNRKPSIGGGGGSSSTNTPPQSPTTRSTSEAAAELNQLKQVKLDLEQNVASLTLYYNQAQEKIAKQSESFMEVSKRLSESEMLVKQKQSMIDDLVRQKSTYELQIENLSLELSQLRQQKERLNALMMNSSSASHMNDDFDNMSTTNTSLNGSFAASYNNRQPNLETQLGFCREKTDNIVAKLGLLKKQNETLNSKIQLIKSLMKEERH